MHIGDDILDAVRTDGYAVMEGFLSADELAAAREGLLDEFPRPDDYFADPDLYVHLVKHQFAGLRLGPFASWPLTRLSFHPDLVSAAERFCGSADLELYKIELWAKYSGAVDYDQSHHRDFGNHSLVVPRRDLRWPQLTVFILLSDVTLEDGPTKVIPRRIGDQVPLIPYNLMPGHLTDHEVAITGPAGSILLYTTDVIHRGSAMTGTNRSRFVLLADYAARGNPWMGKMSWPSHANRPPFTTLMVNTTPRERDLFGFPKPGHAYWNDQTLADVADRWPGIDLTPYSPAETTARISP
jgi:Phytanoyl-CoA dioxygenase (PhyH)